MTVMWVFMKLTELSTLPCPVSSEMVIIFPVLQPIEPLCQAYSQLLYEDMLSLLPVSQFAIHKGLCKPLIILKKTSTLLAAQNLEFAIKMQSFMTFPSINPKLALLGYLI